MAHRVPHSRRPGPPSNSFKRIPGSHFDRDKIPTYVESNLNCIETIKFDKIRIVAWNANGLTAERKLKLSNYIDFYQIDVVLLSETHFSDTSHFKKREFNVHWVNHPSDNARGGVAIMVRKEFQYFICNETKSEAIQSIAVTMKTEVGDITIASIYCPPGPKIKHNDFSEFLKTLGNRFIAGGDWNAKHIRWGSRTTLTRGRALNSAVRSINGDYVSFGSPTHWPTDPTKKPDVIDFFVVKNIAMNSIDCGETDITKELDSDHSPINMDMYNSAILKEVTTSITNKKTDWKAFREELNSIVTLKNPIDTQQQIEDEVALITEQIITVAKRNTPIVRRTKLAPKVPHELLEIISEARKVRKLWMKERTNALKNKLNRLNREVSKMSWFFKNKETENFLKHLTPTAPTDYSLWKATKYLKNQIFYSPPILDKHNVKVKDDEGKAKVFADHLESIFTPRKSLKDECDLADKLLEIEERDNLEVPKITKTELFDLIKYKVKLKKAPGADGITGEILKQLPMRVIAKLAEIFNAIIKIGYVPESWKTAEVIVIPKPNKPMEKVDSYRPISLLSVVSKLFERAYLKRLLPILEERKIIPNHQFGFRASHSTIEQVHRVVSLIERTLENKEVCSMIFLDISAAFDKVWHLGLLFKIRIFLPFNHYKLIKSYLENRKFRVRFNNCYSTYRRIKAGVPQGSCLGPYLYNIFTSDIPKPKRGFIGTFADDTALAERDKDIFISNHRLQKAIDEMVEWVSDNGATLNACKSAHTVFTNRKIPQLPVLIEDEQVPYVTSARYLGVYLDSRLTFKDHIRIKVKELNKKYKKMYWLLGKRSKLSKKNKILLYNQILKPIWQYASQLWGCASKSNINKVERFQSKVLREIIGVPWFVRNEDIRRELEVPTVRQVIAETTKRYECRIEKHINVEALNLLDSTIPVKRLKRWETFELPSRFK